MAEYIAKYNGFGYAMRTALWHLLNEGTVTAMSLSAVSGCELHGMNLCLQRMAKRGLAKPAPAAMAAETTRRFRSYGLTPKGMEAALLVKEADVEIAKPPATEATA
ncbi:MAG: hypothetical protein Q7K57_12795 [Burkholderiaceae bacterium]|nr:hypothetical protein [Burkholderiaceae bacterium]